MKPKSNHQLRCSVCHRLFGRIDHLKRHQLHHTGVKPYCCQFCNEEFTRSDNLRKHYQNCARRGEASIPAIARKGRKRHACDPCIAAKLRCDGEIPCSSCVRKQLECSTRISENSLTGDVSISLGKELSLKTDTEKRVTDFLHIKFLLDGGTDSFTESFHLPPRSDRIRGFFCHIQSEWESGAGFVDLQSEQDPSTNTELAITGSGFDYFNLFLQNGDSSFCSTEISSIDLPGTKQGPFVKEMIQERTISSKMIVSIIDQVSRLDLDTNARQTVLNDLHFLLTPARVRNFISLYFRHWHQNYQMIHLPSFSMDTAPVPLLTAMAFMGALYSCNETESTVARRLLDFAESFVFSTETFTYQHTVGRDLFTSTVTSDPWHDPWHFENFQAATILIIAQYWAGSRGASTRAVEVRFNDLILVARWMGLTHCRHAPEDVIHEALWVQKESQVRTINVVLLLDCAFAFYQNYPCRFSISELVFDLPCNDSFYHAHHPFAQQNFCFSRAVTVFDAFQTLLASKSSVKGSTIISSDSNNGKGFKVSVLDMFILIHVLHSFLNSCITTFIPAMAKVNNSSSTPSPLTAIASALDLWHQLWIGLQAEIADHEWKMMGFYKNGYNFWLVAQLLVEKEKKSVDIITKMDSLCIDRLERLNLLLLEDSSN